MRRTIVTLLLLAVAAWFAPPQMEDTAGQCRALESRVLREQRLQVPDGKEEAAQAVLQRVLQYARERHSDWPGGVGCALVYWELMMNADLALFRQQPG